MQGSAIAFRSGPLAWLRRYRYWFIACITALFLLIPYSSGNVQAQAGYPPFLDPHLNDYGRVVEANDATTIRTTLRQFQQETGIQVVVMTVNSVQDYGTGDRTIESFATNLFNTWGIGDRTRNDGILLLVAPGDRKVRIELGSGYSSRYDAVAQTIIHNQILPYFRDGLISRGVVTGTNGIVSRFRSGTSAQPAVGINPLGGIGSTGAGPRQEVVWGGAIAFGGSLAALLTVFLSWNRHRKRQCPRCQTEMQCLDEQADDAFLRAGQRKEESLESVDYDVWKCPKCGHHQIHSYANWFSRYHKCPGCSTKAMEVHTTTTRHASYTHTGEERIDEHCRHCSHERTRYRTIPRRTRSSSSSGGSGGGGRSSGGGASGSW